MENCSPRLSPNSISADLLPLGGIEHDQERSEPIHIVIVGNPARLGVAVEAELKVHEPMIFYQNRP